MVKKITEAENYIEAVENVIESGGTLAEKAEVPLAYSKRQFLESEKYKKYRDLLNVLLEGNKFYSKSEVEKMIDGYLKRSVK